MVVRMRKLLAALVAGVVASGLLPGSAAADGRHGYVFSGWTGTISYLYTRSEERLSDPQHEFRRNVAVTGTLMVPAVGDPTMTVGWDELSESRDLASCIPPTSAELITFGTGVNRTTGKGGIQEASALTVSTNAKEISFNVPSSNVTYTEEVTRPWCPHFQPTSNTWASLNMGGEVFTGATRLENPEVPKLVGTIERTEAGPYGAGTMTETWRVGYDLTGCGEYVNDGWTKHFEADNRIQALNQPFRGNVARFVAALRAAGATVTVTNVYRPQPRAYLMHYAWRVAYGRGNGRYSHLEPPAVPAYDGSEKVPICWSVPGLDGRYSRKLSIAAARELTRAYAIVEYGAAYPTNHSGRTAIDMNISWGGTLRVRGGPGAPFNGAMVAIPAGGSYWVVPGSGIRYVTPTSTPPARARVRSDEDMNRRLWALGRSYGVIKFVDARNADPPHWSATGN